MKIKDSLLVIFQNDSLFKVPNLHAFYYSVTNDGQIPVLYFDSDKMH